MAPMLAALRALLADGPLELRLNGECMAPALGDRATVRLRAVGVVWPGDVVAYARGDGRLVVHRVVGWRPGAIFTQADHSDTADGAIPRADVLGSVDLAVSVRDRLRALGRFGRLVRARLRARFA